jgi:response regulator of citrate/malate metabolism
MNKLHVILGLIQLGDIEEAKNYKLCDKQNKRFESCCITFGEIRVEVEYGSIGRPCHLYKIIE